MKYKDLAIILAVTLVQLIFLVFKLFLGAEWSWWAVILPILSLLGFILLMGLFFLLWAASVKIQIILDNFKYKNK